MAVVVPIVTEYNGRGLNSALKEIGQAEGALGKLSSAGKILGKTFAAAGVAFAAFKGAQFIGDSVKAASDLGEALSKNRVIFGQYAYDIERFAQAAAQNLGQTQTEALNAASTFATFGKAAGLAGGELTTFSKDLTGLASDLASFWNTNTTDAITAIGAALRNETEPIRRYGVLINQAALEQKAFDMGLTKSLGPLTQQQRTLAAAALIFDQTKDAQGDFARTQDGLANTTRTLNAAFENAKATIGVGFVSAINSATKSIGGPQGLAARIEDGAQETGDFVTGLGLVVDKLAELEAAATPTSKEMSTLEQFWYSLTYSIKASINPWQQATDVITNAGTAARIASENIAAAYDSTIRLAQAQRYAAGQAAIERRKLVDSAYDSGISRLAEERRIAKLTEILGHTPGKPLEDLTKKSGGAAKATKDLGEASEKAQAKFDRFADRVRKSADALSSAQDELQGAWAAFNDYAKGKADWITGQVSIGSAINAQIQQTQKLAELDRQIVDALNSGSWEQAATLQAQRAGESAAVNWVDGFRQQIADAKGATQAINQLMASLNPADTAGNQALLEALTTLPPGQAQMAANDLVARGLGPSIAAELSSLQLFAGGVGQSWASQFYSEGVDAAQAQVDGITAQLQARLNDLYRQGRRMGKAVKDGYNSVVASLPGGGGFQSYDSKALGAGPVNITVNAGHGDPVAIARAIDRTLRTAKTRTGR